MCLNYSLRSCLASMFLVSAMKWASICALTMIYLAVKYYSQRIMWRRFLAPGWTGILWPQLALDSCLSQRYRLFRTPSPRRSSLLCQYGEQCLWMSSLASFCRGNPELYVSSHCQVPKSPHQAAEFSDIGLGLLLLPLVAFAHQKYENLLFRHFYRSRSQLPLRFYLRFLHSKNSL